MRYRWTAYAGISTALAGGVVVKALAQRPNFYSAAVYLSQSSANLMILTNMIFMLSCVFLLSLQKLLYGPLRPIEIEQLYEKAWFAVTETCLAMTIFRGEIGASFLTLFFCLLAAKVWMWIGEGRLEVLEQGQIPDSQMGMFHTRLMASLIMGVCFDMGMLRWIVQEVVGMARPDMMVMFGFEFAVLSIGSLGVLARYVVICVEILMVRKQKEQRREEVRKERREAREAQARATASDGERPTPTTHEDEPIEDAELEVEGWEEKGRWMFYLDLTTDFLKLVIYLSFFFILLVFYGLPIHIMRDVFLTCRSFFKRIADFIRYRAATRDMNARYPDATAAEIGTGDVCIICREEMRAMTPPPAPAPAQADGSAAPTAAVPRNPVAERMRPKKLPCGHILHFSCLKAWLSRQTICPTCRRPVVPTTRIVVGGTRPAGAGGVDGVAPPDGPVRDERNRARVYQFGPLRIGVGAGHGNMFENLAQQIHDGQPRPQVDGAVNNNGDANANAAGPRQYGFGFGIGRTQRRTHRHAATVQGQLDQAQRQILAEIDSLRLAANELQTVRMLQNELTRLRALRPPNTDATGPTSDIGRNVQQPSQTGTRRMNQDVSQPTQVLTGSSQENIIPAGSEQLPQGLQLPEGWTMMPLQRIQPGAPLPMTIPMGVSNPSNQPNQAFVGPWGSFNTGPGQMPMPRPSTTMWSVNGQPLRNPHEVLNPSTSTQTVHNNLAFPSMPRPPFPGSTVTPASRAGAPVTTQAEQTQPPPVNGDAGTNTTTNSSNLPVWGSVTATATTAASPPSAATPTIPLAAPTPTRPVNGAVLQSSSLDAAEGSAEVSTNGHTEDQHSVPESSSSTPNPKHATVEDANIDDLIEGPD